MKKDYYNIEQCKSGKYVYTSEASATRAMNRYSDIKRVYRCDICNNWHLTSMSIGLAVDLGVIDPPKKIKPPSKKQIKEKLKRLIKKVNKDE